MQLKKELNLLDVFCISSGAMLSGLFILPGLAHAQAGPAILVSYILAGLIALTGMLSQAELASAMPKAGGTYFYVTRSMGPAVGTVYGLITWLSLSLKSAYELLFMATFAVLLVHINVHLAAVVLCLVFLGVNLIGIKEAGRVQLFLVFALLAVLLFYVGWGLPQTDVHHFQPFTPKGLGAIISTAGFVFISFGGLLKVASVAEEVKDPGRALPLGMILSLVVTGALYLGVIFVTIGILGGRLDDSLTPISDGAAGFLGRFGEVVYGIAAVLAIISAANAGIMSASRYPLALSRDEMLPEHLGRINARFNTPHVSIFVTGALIIAAMFMKIDILVKAASSVLILTYVFSCLAVVILRESRLQNYRPQFRAPLYPWIQAVGFIGCILLLFELGREAMAASLILFVAGLFVYWFYGRIRATREYALLHLVERVTAAELTNHHLETELKEIVRERDDILKDRFDHIIEECHVLDIDEAISMEEFFRLAADKMAAKLDVEPTTLLKLFLDREKESSTVLNPFLAIPHILVDGEHHFDILLARSREGIVFPEAPKVHTVFVLVGTKDERPFHLRSLAAIAAIVQDPDFEHRWMAAKSPAALRDIVLLGKRKRHH